MKYYLVGIKGTGMCALANFLKSQNESVVGSDYATHFFTEQKLKEFKIYTFDRKNVTNNKNAFFIISYAYNEQNNEEVEEIIKNNYKYMYYSDFINEYTKGIKIGADEAPILNSVMPLCKHLLWKRQQKFLRSLQWNLPFHNKCRMKLHSVTGTHVSSVHPAERLRAY